MRVKEIHSIPSLYKKKVYMLMLMKLFSGKSFFIDHAIGRSSVFHESGPPSTTTQSSACRWTSWPPACPAYPAPPSSPPPERSRRPRSISYHWSSGRRTSGFRPGGWLHSDGFFRAILSGTTGSRGWLRKNLSWQFIFADISYLRNSILQCIQGFPQKRPWSQALAL